ncbi:hypothetical protein Ancab_033207 [Ancistrocladus abbreviatus]
MASTLIPFRKWSQRAAGILLSALSFIVFKLLDFLDAILCIFYAFLDELLEGNASQCYCHGRDESSSSNSNGNVAGGEDALSESLYGRKNVFRGIGLLSLGRKWEESRKKEGNLRRNRWSDCGCESCLSWMKENGYLKLHVVVQEPWKDVSWHSREHLIENVVFLHGFLSSSSYWTETVFQNLSEAAKRNYRLFAVDLLGFGKSPKPRECLYTLKDHLEMIEKSIISPYRLKSFHLVAHSMGCVIALAIAAKYPESVKSLTLVAPPYLPSSGGKASLSALRKLAGKKLWPPLLFGAAFMSWYEHLGRTICFIICRNHRMWEWILRLLMWQSDLHFMIVDFTRHTHHSAWHTMHNVLCGGAGLMDEYLDILSKYGVKITVVQGDQDQVVPLECSYNIKQKAPDANVKIIPNTDHTTVINPRTKEFTQDLEGIWISESNHFVRWNGLVSCH